MKKILGEIDEHFNATEIVCPVCGHDFIHFKSPYYLESDNYEAWEGRGDAIHIPMWCEDGHHFKVTLGFHKGHSFFKIVIE